MADISKIKIGSEEEAYNIKDAEARTMIAEKAEANHTHSQYLTNQDISNKADKSDLEIKTITSSADFTKSCDFIVGGSDGIELFTNFKLSQFTIGKYIHSPGNPDGMLVAVEPNGSTVDAYKSNGEWKRGSIINPNTLKPPVYYHKYTSLVSDIGGADSVYTNGITSTAQFTIPASDLPSGVYEICYYSKVKGTKADGIIHMKIKNGDSSAPVFDERCTTSCFLRNNSYACLQGRYTIELNGETTLIIIPEFLASSSFKIEDI